MKCFIKQKISTAGQVVFYSSDKKVNYEGINEFIFSILEEVDEYTEKNDINWFGLEYVLPNFKFIKKEVSDKSYLGLIETFKLVVDSDFTFKLHSLQEIEEIYKIFIGDAIYMFYAYSTKNDYVLVYWDTDA